MFFGVLPIPSVWYFHFHYEGQPHMFSYLYFALSLLSETNQANLLPAMTVCPEYRSAYRKEALRRHGIRNLEVSIVKNWNLTIFNSRNIVMVISKETLAGTKEIYLRM